MAAAVALFGLTMLHLAVAEETPAKAEAPLAPAEAPSVPRMRCKYLVVGGGLAAHHAVETLLRLDAEGDIVVVAADAAPAVHKPALSKQLWAADEPGALKYARAGADVDVRLTAPEAARLRTLRGDPVERLMPEYSAAMLASGTVVFYDKCLLATGAIARFPDAIVAPAARRSVSTFHSLADFERLAALVDAKDKERPRVVVLGGGPIGSELAVGLARRAPQGNVVHVVEEPAPLAEIVPEYVGAEIADAIAACGVSTKYGSRVAAVVRVGDALEVRFADGSAPVVADHVVACAGAEPDHRLAKASGLEVDPASGGVVVNAEMQARTGVFAAGDAASFYEPITGRRRCEQSYNYAIATATLAAENMVGSNQTLSVVPSFWTVVGREVIEAVGVVDPSLETVGVFAEPPAGSTRRYESGIIYYLAHDRVVGIVTVNQLGALAAARRIVKRGETVSNRADLRSWLPVHGVEGPNVN
jgi:programmed cell death 8 (apoptosis-inducing factor)